MEIHFSHEVFFFRLKKKPWNPFCAPMLPLVRNIAKALLDTDIISSQDSTIQSAEF